MVSISPSILLRRAKVPSTLGSSLIVIALLLDLALPTKLILARLRRARSSSSYAHALTLIQKRGRLELSSTCMRIRSLGIMSVSRRAMRRASCSGGSFRIRLVAPLALQPTSQMSVRPFHEVVAGDSAS